MRILRPNYRRSYPEPQLKATPLDEDSTSMSQSHEPRPTRPRIIVAPRSGRYESLVEAVRLRGGEVVESGPAEALVWADASRPDPLAAVLAENPGLEWVQL